MIWFLRSPSVAEVTSGYTVVHQDLSSVFSFFFHKGFRHTFHTPRRLFSLKKYTLCIPYFHHVCGLF